MTNNNKKKEDSIKTALHARNVVCYRVKKNGILFLYDHQKTGVAESTMETGKSCTVR